MLKIYTADWCPHCRKTIEYLENKGIPFEKLYIEKLPESEIQKVIEVNGGDDWVIPTMQYEGNWIPGKVFSEHEIEEDLRELGVLA